MNHFNAMFEDATTGSWWSQQTGTYIQGEDNGLQLKEFSCILMTLAKWHQLHPSTLVMQPDPHYSSRYIAFDFYKPDNDNPEIPEKGGSWHPNTFLISIEINGVFKVYEWNRLVLSQLISDSISTMHFTLAISKDMKSFVMFENPIAAVAKISNDTIYFDDIPYNFAGVNLIDSAIKLKKVPAYRKYWFSWKSANPATDQYIPN